MTRQRCILFFFTCVFIMFGIGHGAVAQQASALNGNLLVNGNFDELPFHGPLYPNHFVPEGWERWWIHGSVLPEYDDVNKKGGVRKDIYVDGGHALVYFKWGPSYTAGVFQVVNGLTACRPYQLTMYARNHSLPGALPHARIGLDPLGQSLTSDGAVHDPTPLNRTIWSREQTDLFVWEELSVTAEPLGDSLTAILYASPQPGSDNVHYYDTFWDAGALRPAPYANDRLPAPGQATNGFINNVTAVVTATQVTLNWNLNGPGMTQVWYNLMTTPIPITDTASLPYTTYFPLIANFPLNFAHATPVDYGATSLTRSATITNFTSGQIINYIVLARRLEGNTCITEFAGPYEIVTQP